MIELILVSVMALAWVPAVVLGAPSRDAPCRIATLRSYAQQMACANA